MQLTLPVTEALALAAAAGAVPPFVRAVRSEGSLIHAQVDLTQVPDAPAALRWVAAATGAVEVTARFTGYADGVATFAVISHARALPLHVLVNTLTGVITSVLRERGLDDLLEVRRGEGEPVVAVQAQRAVAARADGVVLTHLELTDAQVRVTLQVDPAVRLR